MTSLAPDFIYTTTLPVERTDRYANQQAEGVRGIRPVNFKAFRWRVELFDNRPRVVAEHQQQNGKWAEVRHPDRLAQLLELTPCRCGRQPATPCRDCGVLMCDACGNQHAPPDCPPQLEAYHRDLARMAGEEPLP